MSTPQPLRIAIAQRNPVLGDIDGNLEIARLARQEAAEAGAHLVALSELFIIGYPPEDLVLKPALQDAAMAAVKALAAETNDGGPGILIGTPWREENGALYNSVALLDDGVIQGLRHKVDLPNYGVFDEKRIFAAGPMPGPLNFRGHRIGVPICEDIWQEDVCECLEETGASFFIVPNGSPWSAQKADTRMQVAVARVTETGMPLIYINQVGGQDELVFDGASFALDTGGALAAQLPAWREAMTIVEVSVADDQATIVSQEPALLEEGHAALWQACVLGLRDYVEKNGFPGVVLGLSGGIDSAICAALAVDALGPEHVHCIMLPYRYTSKESVSDAATCAQALGVRYDTIAIEPPVTGFLETLEAMFAGTNEDTTEENLQSRTRGTILMAISNKFGAMVVTTGNKSEVSVGYSTLYGDMNGGFNPIKDLYKTEVYALSRFRNTTRPEGCLGPEGTVIPQNIIEKAPTAELRENQTDQDSLPPYDKLDDILRGFVEEEASLAEIVARGHDHATVTRVQRLLYLAEYKRRQAAPGVKVSERNFGRDRRYPITNRFREN
ncbi:MAG: NAD+ synthase [Pseudomonadota bacterium]